MNPNEATKLSAVALAVAENQEAEIKGKEIVEQIESLTTVRSNDKSENTDTINNDVEVSVSEKTHSELMKVGENKEHVSNDEENKVASEEPERHDFRNVETLEPSETQNKDTPSEISNEEENDQKKCETPSEGKADFDSEHNE